MAALVVIQHIVLCNERRERGDSKQNTVRPTHIIVLYLFLLGRNDAALPVGAAKNPCVDGVCAIKIGTTVKVHHSGRILVVGD